MKRSRSRASLAGTPLLVACLAVGMVPRARAAEATPDAGVVRGTVVDLAGQAVPDASVYVETDPTQLTEQLSATTDAAGAFEIRGIRPGLVRVRVVHPGFSPGGLPEVEVAPDGDAIPVSIVLERGARVEGRVYLRDGSPFTSGWVIVASANPRSDYGWPMPLRLSDEGSFVAEHLPPGRGMVHVLALNPHATPPFAREGVKTLSPIIQQPIEMREAETTVADLTLSDVVLSGRVTRSGVAAAGVTVSVSPGSMHSISFAELPGPPADTTPPALEATTGEDGAYELRVFRPGPARVSFKSAAGEVLPARRVDVPDTDYFPIDFDITWATVSGIVVEEENGAPLSSVSLRLIKLQKGALSPVTGATARDGTFAIGVEEGRYMFTAELLGHARVVRTLEVGPTGLGDLRVEMGRGLSIVGRVVDASGQAAAGQAVIAVGGDGFERAMVEKSGAFRLQGLGEGPYTLSVGSALVGFAVRSAVMPGPEPVRLTLRPAGRVVLRVVDSDKRPVPGAFLHIEAIDGTSVDLRNWIVRPTNEDGLSEFGSPSGRVRLSAYSPAGDGSATVEVPPGSTVPAEIVVDRQ